MDSIIKHEMIILNDKNLLIFNKDYNLLNHLGDDLGFQYLAVEKRILNALC
ncbi:hypothetical protein [Candidatus Contubernalis alkaliaceticus]|uniref:hypothetical protein n=1 Tax=Candidatus Contubernalis alkaliaceticus TaxID=338645 RepID=UPI001F4BE23E|nr:hypothetical protein [Candidatus Contubernalis alkalaceticus]UNC93179.1 hypothetical protein HUE98_14420 [Candidatus Contubernalis alkalaceticus]